MDWGSGREATIAQLQKRVRATGSFVDRAIVREIKIASERFAETHAAAADLYGSRVPSLKMVDTSQ